MLSDLVIETTYLTVYYQSSGIIFASRNTLPAKPVLLLKFDEKFIAKPGAYSFAMNVSLSHSGNTTKDTYELGNADGSRNTGKDC